MGQSGDPDVRRPAHPPDAPNLVRENGAITPTRVRALDVVPGQAPGPGGRRVRPHAPGADRLITIAIDGVPAHDRLLLPDRETAARALAGAWRAIHAVPADDCPFDSTPDELVKDVRDRLSGAETTPIWDAGRGQLREAAEVFAEVVASRPPATAPVVVHGDASAPNVIVKEGEVAGIVDVGLLGRGDPWWDLAACLGSMGREDNDLGSVKAIFMQAYGRERDPDRERWFSLLYRLVFDLPAGVARS